MTTPIEQQLRKELGEYTKDMFLMVWRDAQDGRADKHVVCNSATEMVLKRFDTYAARRADEARQEALQWALNDYNMPDTDTASNLKAYIAELNHKEPKV